MIIDNEIDRFKYSIAVITALSTFSYISYNYIQNNAITTGFYGLVLVLITSSIIYIIFQVLYIFFRGLASEIKNFHIRSSINDIASLTYKCTFLMTFSLMSYSLLFFYVYLNTANNQIINDKVPTVLFYLTAITSFVLYGIFMVEIEEIELFFIRQKMKKNTPLIEGRVNESLIDKTRIHIINVSINIINKIRKIFCFLDKHLRIFKFTIKIFNFKSLLFMIISVFYLLLIYLSVLIILMNFMPGNVQIDANKIYYKNNSPIPVSFQVTGPDNGLLIELSKKSEKNLILDTIELESIHTQNNAVFGNTSILMGNTLENGMYNIFINTTNLSEGYYELICFRGHKYIRGFYLMSQ